MKRAKTILPIFLIFLVISLIIFFFLQKPLTYVLQSVTVPVQKFTYSIFSQPVRELTPQEKLQEENNALRVQLAKNKEIERDNKALRDQFEMANQNPTDLVAADVISTSDDTLILDKGEGSGVKKGDIVILKDNLIGMISKTSPHVSVVMLITHPSTSFTAETVKTQSIGVIKAQGGDSISLDNVVLSDKLENKDLVLTKGDVDDKGKGFPPKLVVGEIISVNKKASSLFQRAQVRSLVDFSKVRMVFIQTAK